MRNLLNHFRIFLQGLQVKNQSCFYGEHLQQLLEYIDQLEERRAAEILWPELKLEHERQIRALLSAFIDDILLSINDQPDFGESCETDAQEAPEQVLALQ